MQYNYQNKSSYDVVQAVIYKCTRQEAILELLNIKSQKKKAALNFISIFRDCTSRQKKVQKILKHQNGT